jgi:DNA-binding beta-propeller fold protein YncE
MKRSTVTWLSGGFGSIALSLAAGPSLAQNGAPAGSGFVAIPGQVGGQDIFGAYDVDPDWPKDIATIPGHEGWTFGAGQSVFAESPDRVFVVQRGELPNIERPETRKLTDIGPSISFPIGRLPWRDATAASPPGALDGDDSDRGRRGVDFRWEHCILVFDREGNLIEDWTQWDAMLRRPHALYISPYDPEKHVWLVDDYRHAVFKFTNDGKTLVQTLGVPNERGSDERHFFRPTFMAWQPDGSFYVADGYRNTRVVKFDKDGNYLLEWGQAGNEGTETRPGYFNNVHGIAVDPETRRVFVNDRDNHRAQVFDENGEFLHEWKFGDEPSDIHMFIMGGDRNIWAADRGTSKILKYDLDGHFLYAFGTWGDFPGGMWGVHGMHVDSEGNLYIAEVDNGGAQKFVPRPGANPDFLIGAPAHPAWR